VAADPRILKYEVILLERDDLVLSIENYLNPEEFLLGGKAQYPIGYCCLNLRETPFLDGLRLFIDGSSRVIQGKDIIDIWR
jgi:hypothetical protein